MPKYRYIVLDSYPLGNAAIALAKPGATPTPSQICRQWIDDCEAGGITFLVPSIAYYEQVRELYQRQATAQITRLTTFCLEPTRHVPLTFDHLTEAGKLWGQLRRTGQTTASPDALDGDAILAAQVLSLGLAAGTFAVVTRNPKHLTRFGLPVDTWENIVP